MSITPRTRRWIRHGAAVAAAAGALALAPTVSASASTLPVPTKCQPTVVRSAELVRTIYGPAIQVTGVAPGPNVDLRLVPEDIVFIQQPDYFPYLVTDCAPDRVVVKTPYTKLFRVPTAPVGKFGIQIGSTQLNLPGAGGVA